MSANITTEQRQRIIDLLLAGHTHQEIWRLTRHCPKTIARVAARFETSAKTKLPLRRKGGWHNKDGRSIRTYFGKPSKDFK